MKEEHMNARKPVNYDELFPGRFLKAGLLRGKAVTLKILDVDTDNLPTDEGKDKTRGVISFEKTPMQLALNSTNGQCLRGMFGKQISNWIGKRVTFVPEMDKFGRETVEAIRIQGSPDIDHDIQVEIKLPRKKPKARKLIKTGKGSQQETTVELVNSESDAEVQSEQQPAETPIE